MKKLSDRQQEILDFIGSFHEENGYPPTVRDIQQGCGVSSTSVVAYNLEVLKKEGYLDRIVGVSRGLRLAGPSARRRDTVSVPLLGAIAAGAPFPLPVAESWSDVQDKDMVDLPQAIVGPSEKVYALRVKGDSMIDALIGDGDLVIMEQTDHVGNGQMAAVRITPDEETTLKFFFAEGAIVRLQPANSQMQPIFVPAGRVQVLSRLVAVWRYLG
ncbi:MAG: repressor LexA [Dehalococcoidia bacterium]|nr:repressor LexA [Dehalococcoidia bacterium]MSQ35175.1 repressor LexA [Dehalococcoidia bacterium]